MPKKTNHPNSLACEPANSVDLRSAVPYIMAHKDKTLIFVLPADLIGGGGKKRTDFWRDLMICHSLGIRCIICLEGIAVPSFRRGEKNRAVTSAQLNSLKEKLWKKTGQCVGNLTRSAHDVLGHVPVLAGNWLLAQPLGVIDGTDYQRRGKLRKADTDAVARTLAEGNIVLLTNLATDKSGQDYALPTQDIIAALCEGGDIKKIVFYTDSLPAECRSLALDIHDTDTRRREIPDVVMPFVRDAEFYCRACRVSRAHLISVECENALLGELFTSKGMGMMLHSDIYEQLDAPEISDMRQIKKMIEPLEEESILRPRSLRVLEDTRERFRIIKQDGVLVGCAALSPIKENPGYVELECVVVGKEFGGRGYGGRLLRSMERLAVEMNYRHLVAVSTQSVAWFRERGYKPTKEKITVPRDCLERKGKILVKDLSDLSN